MASAGTKAFPTYLELPRRVPAAAWIVTRVLVLAATLALVVLLVVRPELTHLFVLQLAIPLLPIVFVAVPGLWRQVCPMAQLNQLPRQLGIGRNRTLPQAWKNAAYLLSALLFMAIVSLRPVVFNDQPLALAGLLLAALALALGGGLLFKGRSGWCGTFCPLAPLQRAYGQAPLLMVRNGYCPTCVGCQKNCYDFNPRAAIHSDLADADSFLAGHKEFFIACLPGLVLGYFVAGQPDQIGLGAYYLNFLLPIGVSLAICTTATRLVPHSRYRVALIASMAALLTFYWFATPAMMAALATLTGVAIPDWVGTLFLGGILAVAGAMALRGLQAERDHSRIAALTASAGATVDLATVKAAWAGATDLIFDRGSGLSIAAVPGRSLLESLESAGVSIDFGCRMGVCGADPVAIIGGADQLSAPGEDEAATLRRLGLTGRARMACVCRPTGGGVTIDTTLDPRTLPEPDNDQSPGGQPRTDPAPELGVGRVVIIGNGSAGTTVADELRRLSPSVKIDRLAEEPHQFYNRMAIGRLVNGQSSVDSLYLMRQDWARARNIDLWLNTVATGIDLARSQVTLGTEEKLDYDRLVLAAGGSASVPPIPGWGIPGCFVLRNANDAISIRAWRQRRPCHSAVVLGGGVLGIEAADSIRKLGLDVTIVQRGPRLMDRQLDERGAAILAGYLERLGTATRFDVSVREVVGDAGVEGVILSDGSMLPAEVFLVCAGIRANAAIAKSAGLEVDRGIIVDGSMRTSDPNVFAIGDVAQLPGAVGGLWAVSTAQAAVAAQTAVGLEAAYKPPSTLVTLKVDGIDVKAFGTIEPSGDQELIESAQEPENEHRRLIVEGSHVAGAVFVGPPGVGKHIAAIVQGSADLSEALGDLRAGRWEALASVSV